MEDSFKVRVERLFGARLFESVPKSSFPESSWSVTDGEVERRLWNRERGVDPTRDDAPCASSYDDKKASCFLSSRKPRRPLDDDDDLNDEEEEEGREGDGDDDEREIRASVGLDSTLDREDEEDEYDRAAFHKEDNDDRIYMRGVNDHGSFMNYHSVVYDFDESTEELAGFHRDPRADHFAANVRLKEDRGADSSDDHHVPTTDYSGTLPMSETNLKPILKRKANQMDIRPKKHVRFDPVLDDSTKDSKKTGDFLEEEVKRESETATITANNSGELPEDSRGIPDYVRNPSKYICYSFDSSDENDDELNRKAFEDFRSIISKSKSPDTDAECATDLPKSVVFTPRKKFADAMVTDQESGSCKGSCKDTGKAIGIAAGDACESEMCAMDEDEVDAFVKEKRTATRKMDRKYRAKASSDFYESQ